MGGGQERAGFVLIHGSELGSWLWERLVPLLQAPTAAVDLPGRGSRPGDPRAIRLTDAVDAVVEDAQRLDVERLVLVAHSFSGVLLPAVASRLQDRAADAVFLGAAVPQPDKAWVDLLPAPQRLILRALYRLRPSGMLSPDGQNRKTLCDDLDEPTTQAFLSRRVAEVPSLLLDAVPTADLPASTRRHYVRLTADGSMPRSTQQAAIDRLVGAEVHELDSGHLPMLSQPGELAALLSTIAERPSLNGPSRRRPPT